jgi:hypothetical protein
MGEIIHCIASPINFFAVHIESGAVFKEITDKQSMTILAQASPFGVTTWSGGFSWIIMVKS